MALINGTDDGALLVEDEVDDWRVHLMELREIRAAMLFEIDTLTKAGIEERLIEHLKQAAANLSYAIADILDAASDKS